MGRKAAQCCICGKWIFPKEIGIGYVKQGHITRPFHLSCYFELEKKGAKDHGKA